MATKVITFRITAEDLKAFDERAADAGARRSDLIRALMALPIEFDVSAIDRVRTPAGDVSEPIDGTLELIGDGSPDEIQCVTDRALAGIRAECRSIGVNYNQSVRALNAFLRKYGSHRYLSDAERKEITAMYKRIAKQNSVIYGHIKGIERALDRIESEPSVNLTARAASADLPPHNNGQPTQRTAPASSPISNPTETVPSADAPTTSPKDQAQRVRHRSRGRKHRDDGPATDASIASEAKPTAPATYSVPSALERPLSDLVDAERLPGSTPSHDNDRAPEGDDRMAIDGLSGRVSGFPADSWHVGNGRDTVGGSHEESLDEIMGAMESEADVLDDK